MATVMNMHWPEVTKDQYDQVRRLVQWETDVPKGAKFHVSWFATDGFHVLDLWETPEDFQKFVAERLEPKVRQVGITSEPRVEFAPSNSIFAPNV